MQTSAVVSPELRQQIEAHNTFGFRLLAWLADTDSGKDVFISPLSVAIALAMVYIGAEGKTEKALAGLLGLAGLDRRQINETNAQLLSLSHAIEPKVQVAIANSLWLRLGLTPSANFTQQIKDFYAGEVAGVDFQRPEAADTINNWVAHKTAGKIQHLVAPHQISPAILILINAIYFKGLWAEPFNRTATVERDFHRPDGPPRRCPMMSRSGDYDYCETGEFQAVSIPYGAGRMSMYVFLPKPEFSISDFRRTLTIRNWQKWMSGFDKVRGDLTLPRFRIEYGQDLLTGLTAIGGDEVAGEDFAGIGAGPLVIANVIHKTVIEVNEEGTEAAAATAVIVARGMPPKPFRLVVDRPFFAAIRDNTTGAVLFAGFVLDPSET